MAGNRIKKINELNSTKFLGLFELEYKNKNGEDRTWMVSSRKSKKELEDIYFNGKSDKVDAVVIAAFHEEEEKLVLIKEFRVPVDDYIYSLPAGLVDPGEDPFVSVKRELKEETGLELTNIDMDESCEKVYLSPGMTDESCAFIYCDCKGEISREFLEDDEDIETILVSREEAENLIKENKKLDIKAYLVMKKFIESGK